MPDPDPMDTGPTPAELAEAAATLVRDNPTEACYESSKVLNTLLANVKQDPSNPKFRKVNTSNAKIRAAVVEPKGAEAVLRACGFAPGDGCLELTLEPQAAAAAASTGQAALDEACIALGAPFALGWQLPHSSEVRAVCGLGDAVVTGAMDNAVRIWPGKREPGEEAQPLETLVKHEGVRGVNGVLAVLETPEGLLASAGRDQVLVWGRGSRGGYGDSPMASMASHGDAKGAEVTNAKTVVALAHGGGGRLWSASWDATVRGWQPQPEGGSGVAEPVVLRAGDVAARRAR
jgi:hypothetical protein